MFRPHRPSWVKKYVGIPFAYKGRTPAGADCYGLICLVYRNEYHIVLADYLYDDNPNRNDIARLFYDGKSSPSWRMVVFHQPDDIVLFHTQGVPFHCGLIIDDQYMLHTSEKIESCIERFTRPEWRNRILAFYRHKEMPA